MAQADNTSETLTGTNAAPYTQFEIQTVAHHKPKEKWSFSFEFVLAGVGYCVMYTNVWRLPYVMYSNGGVVFLFPYLSCIILFAVPMFYLETCLGQFWGKGLFHIWNFCPLFRGLGVSMVIMNAIYMIYSGPFLSWFIYYAALSFSSVLPWTGCANEWNTPTCRYENAPNNMSFVGQTSPTQEFFENKALQLSDGLEDLGSMRWELVGCMFAVTMLMFGALFWGVRLTGKILYVAVPLPLLILFILFIRGVTLPGGPEGIQYLLYPNARKLNNYNMWVNAFVQAMYSTGISSGVLHTLASYNHFKTPSLRCSFTVCIATVGVGLFAGLTLVSYTGALAHSKGLSFFNVMDSGPDLVFTVMPDALSMLPVANVWCFMLYFMLILLGVTKQFLSMEVLVRSVMDIVPHPDQLKRLLVVGGLCFVSLLLTLPFLTQGGMYLIILFDWYSWSVTLHFFIIFECITVAWIYGLDQFSADIKMMTGLRPSIIYKFLWAFIIPLSFHILFGYQQHEQSPVAYKHYIYPDYADKVGYFIAVLPLFAIPVFGLIRLVTHSRAPPLDPDFDTRPDTEEWAEYNAKQRRMERSVRANFFAIFKT